MNFLQILIIFVLPILVISSDLNGSQNKRKENPSDEYYENKFVRISGDTSESYLMVEVDKVENNESQNSFPIFKLPDVLLFQIYSYLKCPYAGLPLVCKNFSNSLKNYPIDLHMKSITSMDIKVPLKPSKDLARLMMVNRVYLNENLDQFLSTATKNLYFSLKTPFFAIQTVGYILRKFSGFKREHELDLVAFEMLNNEFFESFLTILHTFPNTKFQSFETHFVCKFLKFIWTDRSTFTENLHLLIQAYAYPFMFLMHLFSIPNIPDFDTIFNAILQSSLNFVEINDVYILLIIADSFSQISHDDLTDEEIQSIQERNEQYIYKYSGGPDFDFLHEFVRLCSDMISPSYTDLKLAHEFLERMPLYVNRYTDHDGQSKTVANSIFGILSRIAIKRGYAELFIQIHNISLKPDRYVYDETSTPKQFIPTAEMKQILTEKPQFFESLPYPFFIRFFRIYDPLQLLKHKRLTLGNCTLSLDLVQTITAEAELETDPEVLKAALLEFAKSRNHLLVQLFQNIIEYSLNPARTIHKVLLALKDYKDIGIFLKQINNLLGRITYLESLLKPENEDIFESPIDGLVITIDDNTFKMFSDFAKKMGTVRMAPLLKRLVIQWKRIVAVSGLLGSDYESFFEAIGLKFDTFKAIGNDSIEERRALEMIKTDSRCLFVEPKVSPNYIFEILFEEASIAITLERLRTEMNQPSTTVNEINPLRSKFFGIFDYIMEKNLEAFVFHAPVEAISIFKPKIPYSLLKKTLFNPLMFKNILLEGFPKGTVHRISISSVRDLHNYFSTFYQNLFVYFPGHLYVDVFIDWDTIINGAVTEPDFLLIMEFLDPKDFEEKLLGLNQTSKIKEFISFYNQNRDFVPVKQIDQIYLDTFVRKAN